MVAIDCVLRVALSCRLEPRMFAGCWASGCLSESSGQLAPPNSELLAPTYSSGLLNGHPKKKQPKPSKLKIKRP